MQRFLSVTAALALVAACADTEATDDAVSVTGTPAEDSNVFAGGAAVGDLGDVTYDGTDLTVTIPLDSDSDTASYTAAGTSGTYNRYTQQDEPTDRFYTAFAKTSSDGSVTGVVVSDGGQFNRFFGGARVVQNSYDAPTTGLVSYGGEYVGLLNFGTDATGAPAVPGITPQVSAEVTGTVFLNADFNSGGKVNGAIYDRTSTASGFATLEDIILADGTINADGTFEGVVEMPDTDLTNVGSFAGVFGGTNAASVGGVVDLGPGFLETVGLDGTLSSDQGSGFENEYGIFVLDQCPGGGSAAPCYDSEGINQ